MKTYERCTYFAALKCFLANFFISKKPRANAARCNLDGNTWYLLGDDAMDSLLSKTGSK